MVKTLEQSKINDKKVMTVTLWSASVKDWLLLVAGKVGTWFRAFVYGLVDSTCIRLCGADEGQPMAMHLGRHNKSTPLNRYV